ncbi:hypothetical protein BC834DRAFT_213404 [Gloeopeniophorella convolvens]|nr:hypothetical protein BC834DRAFT_213404 [Gloeopeniophorella convolvens]
MRAMNWPPIPLLRLQFCNHNFCRVPKDPCPNSEFPASIELTGSLYHTSSHGKPFETSMHSAGWCVHDKFGPTLGSRLPEPLGSPDGAVPPRLRAQLPIAYLGSSLLWRGPSSPSANIPRAHGARAQPVPPVVIRTHRVGKRFLSHLRSLTISYVPSRSSASAHPSRRVHVAA